MSEGLFMRWEGVLERRKGRGNIHLDVDAIATS